MKPCVVWDCVEEDILGGREGRGLVGSDNVRAHEQPLDVTHLSIFFLARFAATIAPYISSKAPRSLSAGTAALWERAVKYTSSPLDTAVMEYGMGAGVVVAT